MASLRTRLILLFVSAALLMTTYAWWSANSSASAQQVMTEENSEDLGAEFNPPAVPDPCLPFSMGQAPSDGLAQAGLPDTQVPGALFDPGKFSPGALHCLADLAAGRVEAIFIEFRDRVSNEIAITWLVYNDASSGAVWDDYLRSYHAANDLSPVSYQHIGHAVVALHRVDTSLGALLAASQPNVSLWQEMRPLQRARVEEILGGGG
jgi:hypothetical protein